MSRSLKPVPREFAKPPAPEIRTFRELMGRKLPPVRWIVPGVLPEGVTLLAGKAKVRKSWFALGLGTAVAAGGVALGKVPVERGEALYAALEDNERRLQSRERKILGPFSPEAPEGFYYATKWPRLDEGGTEVLAGWLEEHPDCRLVIFDTLAKVRPRPRGSSGGYQEDYEALEELLPLAAEKQVSILVVTHTTKAKHADVLDQVNATTGLMGGVDGFLIFETQRGRAEATVHVEGRDIEEPGELALRWDRELHGWMLVGEAEETRLTEERRAILDFLRDAGGPARLQDIARGVGKSVAATGNLLGKLAVDERVDKAGRGLWALAANEAFTPPTSGGGVKETPHGDAEKPPVYTFTSFTPGEKPYVKTGYTDESGVNGEKPLPERDNFTPPPDESGVNGPGGGVNGEHPWHCGCPECS